MEHFEVDGAVIEYETWGDGEPVLLIHPGLCADGLGVPLHAQPDLTSRYRLVHYHRRGYMGSTLGSKRLTIPQQAADAAALLRHLDVKSAHVAGHSLGAAIALQLAVDSPRQVYSLSLMEPLLQAVPGAKTTFEQRVSPMIKAYHSGDRQQAVQIFSDNIFGPNWRSIIEQAIPGGVQQEMKDVDTFIREISDSLEWQLGSQQASLIHQPVLSVVGIHSHTVMLKGRALIHSWCPQTEDYTPPTNHLLQIQNPQHVAHGLAEFFARHPMN